MPHLSADLAAVLYTVSAVLFILALRGLSSPETSRRGNTFGMIGIAIAIVTTLLVTGMSGMVFCYPSAVSPSAALSARLSPRKFR